MIAYDIEPRCHNCGKLLAEQVTRPWAIRCGRCKSSNTDAHQGMPRATRLVQDLGAPQRIDSRGDTPQ